MRINKDLDQREVARCQGFRLAATRDSVRDCFFKAAPLWELRLQGFPPGVYHDQQGAAASNFQQPLGHPRSPHVQISSSQRES